MQKYVVCQEVEEDNLKKGNWWWTRQEEGHSNTWTSRAIMSELYVRFTSTKSGMLTNYETGKFSTRFHPMSLVHSPAVHISHAITRPQQIEHRRSLSI